MGRKSRRIRKLHKSIKHIGLICAFFTAAQSAIWICLTILGFFCFFLHFGTSIVALSFKEIYMDIQHSFTSISYVAPPIVFMLLILIYFAVSIVWLRASYKLIVEFGEWSDYRSIKQASRRWILITTIVCVVDVIVFLIFTIDLICIHTHFTGSGENQKVISYYHYPHSNESYNAKSLRDTVQDQRINNVKEDVKYVNNTLENKTGEDVLNPFLQKKIIWDKIPWITKLISKKQDITSEKMYKNNWVMNIGKRHTPAPTPNPKREQEKREKEKKEKEKREKEKREKEKNKNGTTYPPEPELPMHLLNPVLPAIICMIFASRGIIAWNANLILMLYFRSQTKQLRDDRRVCGIVCNSNYSKKKKK